MQNQLPVNPKPIKERFLSLPPFGGMRGAFFMLTLQLQSSNGFSEPYRLC